MIKAEVVFDYGKIQCNGFTITTDYGDLEIYKGCGDSGDSGVIVSWGYWTEQVDGCSLECAIKYCLEN